MRKSKLFSIITLSPEGLWTKVTSNMLLEMLFNSSKVGSMIHFGSVPACKSTKQLHNETPPYLPVYWIRSCTPAASADCKFPSSVMTLNIKSKERGVSVFGSTTRILWRMLCLINASFSSTKSLRKLSDVSLTRDRETATWGAVCTKIELDYAEIVSEHKICVLPSLTEQETF